ncbi:MAG: cell division protein ZipA C-terminal FtsZ-binding domain-containing protein, partial [Gammaproteobacteria bacterium]|nr:cell division protein ZipA C-terminal FtsZ-binding domain-containing protein [Gammaproteobacteria bacterium]
EIVNTKLDKSNPHIPELSTAQIVPQASTADQASDFKEVFEDALNQQKQAERPSKIDDALNLNADLSVSLPDMLHGQIDLTALLYLSVDTPVSKLNKSLTGLFDNLDKPVFIHVLDSNKQWHLLKDIQSNQDALNRLVSKVSCSLQLADRGGAVDRNVLNRFQLAVETLGLDVNGHVEWQNSGDALSAANSLDLFCIEVDKTIGFHLVHGESGAFTGTKLRGLAEAQGLLLTSDGAFKYFDQSSDELSTNKQSLVKPQLHPAFMMFNRDDHPFSPDMLRSSVVKGITFQLDIPHVKHATETFNHMIQVAKQMEIGLNAVLVDDNNKVLGDIQIERIRQQLKVLQATMLARGVVPGSDNAHRLFS